jgi:hypothetical protein
MRLPLSDGLGHHPSSSIARLGFPAKQLWFVNNGEVELDP